MNFNPGIEVRPTQNPLGFVYGKGVTGPVPELRKLDAIRKSLLNPDCDGPEVVYAIAMDVHKAEHKPILFERMLLYGVVTYAAGRLGDEPIRSQGHVHAVSTHSNWSPPELYEIWHGTAIIYMQERAQDDPGRCFAIYARAGEKVLVPPGWAHSTISADPASSLTFGAWCDREYRFEYDDVRAHQGLAYYPVWEKENLIWMKNAHYSAPRLVEKQPESYTEFGLDEITPIYSQFEQDPERMQFVSNPYLKQTAWEHFVP